MGGTGYCSHFRRRQVPNFEGGDDSMIEKCGHPATALKRSSTATPWEAQPQWALHLSAMRQSTIQMSRAGNLSQLSSHEVLSPCPFAHFPGGGALTTFQHRTSGIYGDRVGAVRNDATGGRCADNRQRHVAGGGSWLLGVNWERGKDDMGLGCGCFRGSSNLVGSLPCSLRWCSSRH